jgi:hypothetical protein
MQRVGILGWTLLGLMVVLLKQQQMELSLEQEAMEHMETQLEFGIQMELPLFTDISQESKQKQDSE